MRLPHLFLATLTYPSITHNPDSVRGFFQAIMSIYMDNPNNYQKSTFNKLMALEAFIEENWG